MRTVRSLPAAVAVAILLGACGGGGGTTGPNGAGPASLAPSATSAPSSTGSTGSTTTATVAASGSSTEAPAEIPEDALDLRGQESVTVVIEDNVFVQRAIVVSPRTKVTWVNKGRNPHNVTPSEEGSFEPLATAVFDDGGSGSRTFDAGTFAYYCSIHGTPNRGQRGVIYVVP